MPINHPNLHLTQLSGAIPAWSGNIKPDDLQPICRNVHDGGGRSSGLIFPDHAGIAPESWVR